MVGKVLENFELTTIRVEIATFVVVFVSVKPGSEETMACIVLAIAVASLGDNF